MSITHLSRAVTKSKELEVHQSLRDAQITFEHQHYLPFRGCGLESETAHAFADFAFLDMYMRSCFLTFVGFFV